MVTKPGVRSKVKLRRKSFRGRSLVKCGKCSHTARNHFKLRHHSAKYHRLNGGKVGKLQRNLRSRRKRSKDRAEIGLTSGGNRMKSPIRVGNLVVMSDDNLQNPPLQNTADTVKNEPESLEYPLKRPRRVYTRKPIMVAPPVSSSGRKLRSSRCSSECCSVDVPKGGQKRKRESLESKTISKLKSDSSKSNSDSSKSKIGSSKSRSDGLKSKNNSSKSKSSDLKSKNECSKRDSSTSKSCSSNSKSSSLRSKSSNLKSEGDSSKSKSVSSKSKVDTSKSKRGQKVMKKREKRLMVPMPCHKCNYIGRDSYNLRRHMQSKHEPKPPKTPKVYQCEQCEYKNRYRFLVKRHSVVHSRERKGEKHAGFACDKCPYVSTSACNLKRHQQCRHEKIREAKLQCSLCDHREPDRPTLFGHFREAHGVIIETERLEFEDFQSFMDFKSDIEKATLARFVRQQTRMGEKKRVIFKCHRDGMFKSKSRGERKRALKTTGSNKINSACPASMRLTIDPNGKVSVVFTKTHVGHSNEVCRLTLTKEEKLLIGEMLESKRTFVEILCEIRSGMDSERLERIHLLSRKDLQNIEKWYKSRDAEEAPRTHMDIDIAEWVNKVMKETNAIRLYKKPACILPKPHKCLEYDDFVLILANDIQLAMLRKYGNQCLCIDNAYENAQVKLTSLMVLDDGSQGFPCAFMLSSKLDKVIMKVFLEVIRRESGCPLTPSVLVLDIPECRRTEWSVVMDLPKSTNVFYSPWSIEDDLNRNLLKIKSEGERQEAYKIVKNLICENTVSEVEIPGMISKTVKLLEESPSTELFGKYVKSRFADSAPKWARGFTNRLHVDISDPLDSMHEILKFVYSEGMKNDKLEDCVNVLMSCSRDQLLDRTVLDEEMGLEAPEGETGRLLSCIATRHEDAESMKSRSADSGVYEIMEHNLQCSCRIRCIKCEVCIHSYRCTCYGSILGWTICRHIHFCVMSNAEQQPSVTLVGQPFDPVEEKRKLLLEFENMCGDIAAGELVSEPAVVEAPVEELPTDAAVEVPVEELPSGVDLQEHRDLQEEGQLLHQSQELQNNVHSQRQRRQEGQPPQLSQDLQEQEEEVQEQSQPVIDQIINEGSKFEIPLTSLLEEKPPAVETSPAIESDATPRPFQQPKQQVQQPQQIEDAKSKLHQRFQSICQLMSSDVDVSLIEQALESMENAIVSKRASTI